MEYACGDTHSFSFFTTDVSIGALMHAFEGFSLRWFVSPEGIEMNENACLDRVSYYCRFPASSFGSSFKCSGPVCVAFNPKHMYTFLKSHQQRDVCKWEFNPKKPSVMKVTISSKDGCANYSFDVRLQVPSLERDMADRIGIDYLVVLDSVDILSVIQGFGSICKSTPFVEVRTCSGSIEFIHDTGLIKSNVGFRLDPNSDTKKDTEEVSNLYSVQILQQIQKCFMISRGAALIFLKQDFPLIFEVKVGTLGKLRVGVVCSERESDFKMDQDEEAINYFVNKI